MRFPIVFLIFLRFMNTLNSCHPFNLCLLNERLIPLIERYNSCEWSQSGINVWSSPQKHSNTSYICSENIVASCSFVHTYTLKLQFVRLCYRSATCPSNYRLFSIFVVNLLLLYILVATQIPSTNFALALIVAIIDSISGLKD